MSDLSEQREVLAIEKRKEDRKAAEAAAVAEAEAKAKAEAEEKKAAEKAEEVTPPATEAEPKVKTHRIRQAFGAIKLPGMPSFKKFWLFAAVFGAIAAAQLTLFWRPMVGVYVNAVMLALLIGLALWREVERPLLVSAAIVPIANMICLSLPQTSTFAQLGVFYSVLLVLGMVYRVLFTIDFPMERSRLTWRGYGMLLPLMMVLGQALGLAGFGLLRQHYIFGHAQLPLVAASAVVFAIAEETFLRGLIQQRASTLMHPFIAALLATVLMVLTSLDHATILAPLAALMTGTCLAFVYYKKQNLLLTIVINASAKLTYIGLMAAFVFRR